MDKVSFEKLGHIVCILDHVDFNKNIGHLGNTVYVIKWGNGLTWISLSFDVRYVESGIVDILPVKKIKF